MDSYCVHYRWWGQVAICLLKLGPIFKFPFLHPVSNMLGIHQKTGYFEDSGLELWLLSGILLHFVIVA